MPKISTCNENFKYMSAMKLWRITIDGTCHRQKTSVKNADFRFSNFRIKKTNRIEWFPTVHGCKFRKVLKLKEFL